MIHPAASRVRPGLVLLLAVAAAQPAFAMGRWPEPSIDEEDKATMTSAEGTITGLNLESEPPLVALETKTGKKLVLMMDPKTTAVWINEKLKAIRHLKLGDGVKLYYIKKEGRGLVTGVEVHTRAAPAGRAGGGGDGGLGDDLKALKKGVGRQAKPPVVIKPPIPQARTPMPNITPTMPPVQRPPMPGGSTSTTTERRPVR